MVVSTLQQLDSLDTKDHQQRADVYTMVAQNIPNIPKVGLSFSIHIYFVHFFPKL